MVMTMKVPPTHSAAATIERMWGNRTGNSSPTAIAIWLAPHIVRLEKRRCNAAETRVDTKAAAPNTGHPQPKIHGEGTISRAIAGRNVPGNILSVGSYLAILSCVAAGTGYAVVPQSVLDTVSLTGSIRCYPLPGKLSRITTMVAWRDDYRSVNFDALLDLLSTMKPSDAPLVDERAN